MQIKAIKTRQFIDCKLKMKTERDSSTSINDPASLVKSEPGTDNKFLQAPVEPFKDLELKVKTHSLQFPGCFTRTYTSVVNSSNEGLLGLFSK